MRKDLASIVILAAFCVASATAGDNPYSGPQPLSDAQIAKWSDSDGFKRGVASANAKIQQGELVFRSHGFALTPKSQRVYLARRNAILARYKISFTSQGCMGDKAGEDSGYNHRMAQEVLSRYGDNFWQRIDQESQDGV